MSAPAPFDRADPMSITDEHLRADLLYSLGMEPLSDPSAPPPAYEQPRGEEVRVLLGELTERQILAATPWIGEHPIDRGELGMLLVHPTRDGVAEQMRELAGMLGMRRPLNAPTPRPVPADTFRLQIADESLQVIVRGTPAIERSITPDWVAPAAARGLALVIVGEDGYLGDLGAGGRDQEDAYLRQRGTRVHWALIDVTGTSERP
jgi:hypothetical protein